MTHRFYIPPDQIAGDRLRFTEEQRKQIRNVLRLSVGDSLAVFDGSGRELRVCIESLDGTATGSILSESRPDTEPAVRVTLVQSLPKGEKIDFVLQKCTEIGVSEFIIMESTRCVARIPKDRLAGRIERWRAIVREAAEQCGRVRLPHVGGVLPFRDALVQVREQGRAFIAWEGEESLDLSSELARLSCVGDVVLFIGPEGGFTPDEVAAAEQAGITPVSLGRRILRTETAAIVGTALLVYRSPGVEPPKSASSENSV